MIIIGTNSLVALKALRLLRVFRILKLAPYIGESNALLKALKASGRKIFVFLFSVVILCVIFGSIMYLIENEKSGFTSIPRSIYWCIVTLTTVGYGDIAPITPFGQFLASIIMVLGYGIIAVPTGIVTAEMTKNKSEDLNTQSCPYCMNSDHKENAIYCHECGKILNDENTTLIYVAGPTSVGKTKFSIELAKKFKTEILSCDSRQFYKEISIGTGAPGKDELSEIKHHFIQHKSSKRDIYCRRL